MEKINTIIKKEIENWRGDIKFTEKHEREVNKYEEIWKRVHHQEMLENLRIPKRYWKVTLNFKSKVCKYIKQFIEKKSRCLVISGGAGCGKTSGVCAYLIEQHRGMFVDVSEIKTAVFSYDFDFLDDIKKCDILVIDDLGLEHKDESGFFASIVDEIFNTRYSQDKITLITTNLNIDGFRERYGERVIDRIREWGSFIETKEKSFRRDKRKKV